MTIPDRLESIIQIFQESDKREKIELLLEFSENMPGLPERIQAQHASMDFVEECMTPVYVIGEIEDGGFRFYFDVPPESPTVRGFAAILADGLQGATAEQILSLPNDFYRQFGLEDLLTMQRLNGFNAILAYIKRIAARSL